jgi:hypothetical protein
MRSIIAEILEMARSITGGETFKVYGDEYPDDSKNARLMAEWMPPPDRSLERREWEMFRDLFLKRRLNKKDVEAVLVAFESGDANMVLRGRARSPRDLDTIARRLGIMR